MMGSRWVLEGRGDRKLGGRGVRICLVGGLGIGGLDLSICRQVVFRNR